ncbi:MAG: hypothetical protein OEY67_05530 [Gammaproteobacteria bacterium]|nr:hypothetical protein [Gammaproteobacteria bacterium]
MISATEALERVKEGNRRFVSGVCSFDTMAKQMQQASFAERQAPLKNISNSVFLVRRQLG